MGIDRVIQDQKEKTKQKKQFQNNDAIITCINNVAANETFDKKSGNISQNKRVIKKEKDNTIATRNPDHHKKIENVKKMLNLK
ncbi:MAG: hypothetical protein ACT6FF_07325 [Methanosarcinaceae archaeon]